MRDVIDDLLKQREEFLKRLRHESRRVADESVRAASADPQELLARYGARIDAAKRAKEEAIHLHEEEVAHYSALVKEVKSALAAKDDDRSYRTREAKAETKPRKPATRGTKRREK
jgi:hypothetical protein